MEKVFHFFQMCVSSGLNQLRPRLKSKTPPVLLILNYDMYLKVSRLKSKPKLPYQVGQTWAKTTQNCVNLQLILTQVPNLSKNFVVRTFYSLLSRYFSQNLRCSKNQKTHVRVNYKAEWESGKTYR